MYESTMDQQLPDGVSGSAIFLPPAADQNPRSAVTGWQLFAWRLLHRAGFKGGGGRGSVRAPGPHQQRVPHQTIHILLVQWTTVEYFTLFLL